MIPASYYQPIYLFIVTILTFICLNKYRNYSSINQQSERRQGGFILIMVAALFTLFIGLRPISEQFFVDMASYASVYQYWQGEEFDFNWDTENLLFDNLMTFLSSKAVPVQVFFLLIAAIYLGGIAIACSVLFPQDKLIVFLVYLGAFSTFSYGTNGIKAGAAASLFLMALSLYKERKVLLMALFLLLSLGFHHSMVLPVAAFIICIIVKNPRWYFFFWVLCFFVALLHITYFQHLFAGFTDDQGASYLLGDGDHVRHDIFGGFRIDFVLYSAAPIVVGWFAIIKKRIHSRKYCFLLNLYTFTNAIWMLCMYAEFTNRIAYLSWSMYPFVLVYPYLKEHWSANQHRSFQLVSLCHLAFTLFMVLIYYA